MRIAMVTPGRVPARLYGGTERVVGWLVAALAGLGHEVVLAGPPGCEAPQAESVIALDMPADPNAAAVDPTPHLPPGIDVLHLHFASGLDFGLPALKTVHGYPFHRQGEDVLARREQFGPEYSFVSRAHAETCGWPEADFVHNGLELSEYVFREAKQDFLLFLGKVDWNVKGLPFALRLAREEGMRLVIAGDFLDPRFYEQELKAQLGGGIEYAGPVGGADKAELLASARALVFPTLWPEPFGLAAIEALASGTPVLATYNGALPEIMVQGVTGFMARSFPETREQLRRLDSIDPKACRRRVEERFTARRMAEGYLALYAKRIRAFAGR